MIFLYFLPVEIRTPLSGVMGMINLLYQTRITREQMEMLQTATMCGEQLLVIINDILDLTKMEEKKMTLESAPFSIHTSKYYNSININIYSNSSYIYL